MSYSPTSLRLAPAEKRRIAAAARRRGLTPTAYIKRAALDAASAAPDDTKLKVLHALVAQARGSTRCLLLAHGSSSKVRLRELGPSHGYPCGGATSGLTPWVAPRRK